GTRADGQNFVSTWVVPFFASLRRDSNPTKLRGPLREVTSPFWAQSASKSYEAHLQREDWRWLTRELLRRAARAGVARTKPNSAGREGVKVVTLRPMNLLTPKSAIYAQHTIHTPMPHMRCQLISPFRTGRA
ncbi:hypothetical protein A2U01_0034440, partial [Trifolium medium]|nr:hypothetical protein [Trifolium medium]